MGASLHVSLPDEMRRFVDDISNGKSLYATPSEYVRALIRKDMEQRGFEVAIRQGLDEANRGEFATDDFVDTVIGQYT